MPTACMFRLRPAQAEAPDGVFGRAAHAAILSLIAEANPKLAERIHADERIKPLTVSDLQHADEQTDLLRVTLLDPQLEALAREWTPVRIPSLSLAGRTWNVQGISTMRSQHPWAGRDRYEDLLGGALERSGEPPARWSFEFASPVTFRQRGRNQPIPLPELVFGSLLDRWNALAPIPLPEGLRSYITDAVVISRFDMRSAPVPTKNGALQIGAVGRCAYTVVERDRAWQTCLDTLARFAFYSGVGAGTARGFGQCRMIGPMTA